MAGSGLTAAAPGSDAPRWLIPRPKLFELLSGAERIVYVSAPTGSGKTFLLRSWIAAEGLGDRVAWVSVAREEGDPQTFWLSVVGALRQTRAGAELVRDVTASPDLDAAMILARLLEDLETLDEELWLVIDDLHELRAQEALDQIEVLLASVPPALRFVLLTRRDVRLGLHRLRLEGELTEIRAEDLRFDEDESRALLQATGVRLSDASLQSLVATTEGWAAGLRLAALSMARDPDPERFAAGFSGRERAVAEHLLAEVLERQPEEVSRLLLRTSLLERVSGPLADHLTGSSDSYRILTELEDAGAFVVAIDPERTWFRYHNLFADLLALELRRTAPQEVPRLHMLAAEWLAAHGDPVGAIRHAQAAESWSLAAQVLTDAWPDLYLDGRTATARELVRGFPVELLATNAELAALAAADRRAGGAPGEADRYLALAEDLSASVPEQRQGRFQVWLVILRLSLAQARNDLDATAAAAGRLVTLAESPGALEAGFGADSLRALALVDLGAAELFAGRIQPAERHLEQGLQLARRIDRPMLELQALAPLAMLNVIRSRTAGEQQAADAVDLARAHGWEATAPAAAAAYVAVGGIALWRGRLAEAEEWLDRAEDVLNRFAQPTTAIMLYASRAWLEFARGRHEQAMTAQRAVEEIERALAAEHIVAIRAQAVKLQMLAQAGETDAVRQALDEIGEQARAAPEMRIVEARLALAQGDLERAAEAIGPVSAGTSPLEFPRWEIQALLIRARIDDAAGDAGASSRAFELALDRAEPQGLVLPFLLDPAPELLERHLRLRSTHASLASEILDLLSGRAPAPRPHDAEPLLEQLTESELRVLRYLPTNLRAPEIASELFVSINTIRTHMRNLYAKLGVHSRADAVMRARELGLLSPSSRVP